MSQAVMVAKSDIGEDYNVVSRRNAVVAAQVLLLGVGYILAAQLGLGFRFENTQVAVVWPANALIVGALLLMPRSRWWMVFAAMAPIHIALMYDQVPAWRWAWQIAGNVAYSIATAVAIRHFVGQSLHFSTRKQVFTFGAIAFALPLAIAPTTPSFVLSVLGVETFQSPGAAFLRVTLTNATGLLFVLPVVLLWGGLRLDVLRKARLRQVVETAVIMISVVIVALIAFGTGAAIARFPSILLLTFLPLLWAAVKTGPVGASTALLLVAALSMWGTAGTLGPFVLSTDVDKVLSLQLFWIVIWAPIMLMAAVIREREQAESALHEQHSQLAHVARVSTFGELSGALAHELRQPLMSILANAQAGIRLLAPDRLDVAEVTRILHDIADDDRHAASVIGRMRSFLREGESRLEDIAIDSVVRDTVALSHNMLELSSVRVETRIPPGLPTVRGDPVQLLQLLLNLVVNGCESMGKTPPADRRLLLHAAPLNGSWVELVVTDSGSGLPRGLEDRVFDPFFTTKESGLGLGLSICRSIVTAHGGRLWAENNSQRGATFHLILHTDGANGRTADRDT